MQGEGQITVKGREKEKERETGLGRERWRENMAIKTELSHVHRQTESRPTKRRRRNGLWGGKGLAWNWSLIQTEHQREMQSQGTRNRGERGRQRERVRQWRERGSAESQSCIQSRAGSEAGRQREALIMGGWRWKQRAACLKSVVRGIKERGGRPAGPGRQRKGHPRLRPTWTTVFPPCPGPQPPPTRLLGPGQRSEPPHQEPGTRGWLRCPPSLPRD